MSLPEDDASELGELWGKGDSDVGGEGGGDCGRQGGEELEAVYSDCTGEGRLCAGVTCVGVEGGFSVFPGNG